MGASVRHKIKQGFVLDEERIRKINDLIVKRLGELKGNPQLSYKVYRADAFVYSTLHVQDVINEENLEWQKMERLSILLTYPDTIESSQKVILELHFNSNATDEPPTTINIEGEERDFVYLFFSDLREYLQNEVNIIKSLKQPLGKLLTRFLAVLAILILLTVIAVISSKVPSGGEIGTLMSSQDTNEKLNYLIKAEEARSPGNIALFMWISGASILLYLLSNLFEARISKWGDRLVSSSTFLFGREIDRYNSKQAFRNKLIWGVIVASAVSIITGLLVWLLTRGT